MLEIITLTLPYSQQERKIRIYLPDNYLESQKNYPTIYMQDGQNVFYDHESYSQVSWKVMESLQQLNLQDQFIVIAIDNAGANRFNEYCPFEFNQLNTEGQQYADFVVNTVKPYIDQHYPTKPNRKHTAIIGSSMGALISAYIAFAYNDVFKYVGVFSLASYFVQPAFSDYMQSHPVEKKTHFMVTVGTNEGRNLETNQEDYEVSQRYLNDSLQFVEDALLADVALSQLHFSIHVNEIHHEKDWIRHFKEFLQLIINDKK